MSPSIALPISPQGSSATLLSPSYQQQRNNPYSNSRSPTYSRSRSAEIRDDVINNAEKFHRRFMATYNKLTPAQRILALSAILAINVVLVLFLIFNERIFGFLEPYADKWKHTTGGWIILWTLIFAVACPPAAGYGTLGTMAGFIYGVVEGWFILATATVAGSYCAFIISRTVLRKYVEKLVANDKRFAALTLTLKEDGLKLICMIRLCPLPYSLSNGAMATIPSVDPSAYALATALVTPKLFIPVFIGSRLAKIAKKKGEMPLGTKILNWTSIILFGLLGAFVGWFIYKKTMQRARELEANEEDRVQDSVRRTGRIPTEFADDPEAQRAAGTLARPEDDEDDMAYFDDDDAPRLQSYRDQGADEDDVFAKGDMCDSETPDASKSSTR